MIQIIIISILLIIVILQAIIIYRKILQNEKYEDVLNTYESWVENFSLTVQSIDDELDRIDSEGTFRSDDEVGFFYQAMYSILKRLSEYGIIDEEEINYTGEELNGEEKNVLYKGDRERNRRIQRVRRPDISVEDIQRKNRETDK